MNELSNFCNVDGNGQTCENTASSGCPAPGASQTDCCLVCHSVDSTNKYDYPPYAIGNYYGKLGTKTVAASATHYGNVQVYDAHNLYGLTEQIATSKALIDIRKKRPFLLSRSSFLSTGKWSAKWTGDNGATWNDLKSSVISIMDFNMFGIPMIGADICGFIYDTTEELCARWIEVGSFYPFVRNHNALNQKPQELYLWDSVATASRSALGMRYQLLPYLYTLFFQANQVGDTVIRPLWMNFASDAATHGIQEQFMWGNGLLISPVLEEGSTNVSAYFPQQLWYDFADRSLAVDASAGGVWKTLSTPLTSINVHVNGGNILPLQRAAMTTTEARKTPFTLLTALCPYGKAWGKLFYDDGEEISLENYLSVSYDANGSGSSGSFRATIDHNTYIPSRKIPVEAITIMGKDLLPPSSATLNGIDLTANQIVYDSVRKSITFTNFAEISILHIAAQVDLQWK
jgi:alpha-glucosidase (family GH31 glycosyl hydrolase)